MEKMERSEPLSIVFALLYQISNQNSVSTIGTCRLKENLHVMLLVLHIKGGRSILSPSRCYIHPSKLSVPCTTSLLLLCTKSTTNIQDCMRLTWKTIAIVKPLRSTTIEVSDFVIL